MVAWALHGLLNNPFKINHLYVFRERFSINLGIRIHLNSGCYAGEKIYCPEYLKFEGGEEKPKKEESLASKETIINGEFRTQNFQNLETNAQDACDLKQVAGQLAEVGDQDWPEDLQKS